MQPLRFLRPKRRRSVGGIGQARSVDFFISPDGRRGLEAVYLRHLHIHKHDVEDFFRQLLQDLATTVDQHHRVTAPSSVSRPELSTGWRV